MINRPAPSGRTAVGSTGGFDGKFAKEFQKAGFENGQRDSPHGGSGRNDEVAARRDYVLMAAEHFPKQSFAAVALNGVTDRPRGGHADARWTAVAARPRPKQEPTSVQSPAGFTRGAKIHVAAHALHPAETKANLRGVRQR